MRTLVHATLGLIMAFSFSTSALAGRLDPRLSALTQGGRAFVKSTATGAVNTPRPANPMLPRVRSNGTVQVYIHAATRGAELPSRAEIAAVGGSGIRVSPTLGVIQTWVPIARLNALANLPNVGLVTVPTYAAPPRPFRPGDLNGPRMAARASAMVPTGLAIDQSAVLSMQAQQLRQVGAIGSGVKVGVISDDNSGLNASQTAGYLPSTVWADASYPGTSPTPGDPAEGTAMLEEVHAMAPGASLGFCGPQTTVDFITCYDDFATWGANVIADDLGFYVTDYFSIGNTADQSFAYAITSFTQVHPDIAITSSAGNDAQDYFEAPYTAGTGFTVGSTTYQSAMDFGVATGGSSSTALAVTISPGNTFRPFLEWNDPLGTSQDTFDMYLVSSSGTILAMGQSTTTGNGRPLEYLQYTPGSSPETDYIYIGCVSCANPVTIKLAGNGNGGATFGINTYGSENAGQKVANGVMATGASWVYTQSPLSINREAYSDVGPFLYGSYGATSTLPKPDLTGIDDVLVSGAGGFGMANASGGAIFCGTSATGPNVAALIADLMQAEPANPSDYYYSALKQTANQAVFTGPTSGGDCGGSNTTGYSQNLAGSGLAQGYDALSSLYTFPQTSITAPVSVQSGQSGNVTVPVNVNITYSATAQGGTNTVATSDCVWTANSSVTQIGASVVYTATATGSYQVVANCPDSNGIGNLTPPELTVNAQNIAVPTASVSNNSKTGFNLTLTGYEPLTVSAASSNSSVLPSSGITISPATCGISTLNCTVSLNPVAHANGTTTVTITATDPWSRSGTAKPSETYSYTPPSSGGGRGGGGALSWLCLLVLGILVAIPLTGLTPTRPGQKR